MVSVMVCVMGVWRCECETVSVMVCVMGVWWCEYDGVCGGV